MQRIRTACAVAGLMISGAALGQGNPLASEVARKLCAAQAEYTQSRG